MKTITEATLITFIENGSTVRFVIVPTVDREFEMLFYIDNAEKPVKLMAFRKNERTWKNYFSCLDWASSIGLTEADTERVDLRRWKRIALPKKPVQRPAA